jgi:hypothetical protein
LIATNGLGSSIIDSTLYNLGAPILTLSSFEFGSVDTRNADPTWNWTNSGGPIDSYYLYIYHGVSNPPSENEETPTLELSDTSYVYTNPTVPGNYYRLELTATNATGSGTLSDIQYITPLSVAPGIEFVNFAWLGTKGTIESSPSWTWSNSSGGIVNTYYVTFYLGTTSNLVNYTYDGIYGGGTTFTYSYTTEVDYYFRLELIAENEYGYTTILSDIVHNDSNPLSLISFSFTGTQGSSSASPTWTWIDYGDPSSYPLIIYGDVNDPPTTELVNTTLPSGTTTYTYSGTTDINYYYKISLEKTVGQIVFTLTDTKQNTLDPPNLLLISFSFGGSVEGTSAAPTWTWINSGDSASYEIIIYGDTDNPPTTELVNTTLSSGTTSYTYSDTTVPNYYYKISLVATNDSGTSSITDTRKNSEVAWYNGSIGSFIPYKMASSSDGTILAAIATLNGISAIIISKNSGATWQNTNSPSLSWSCITVKSDGSLIIAGPSSGSLYAGGVVLNDPDVYWYSLDTPSKNWTSVAISFYTYGYGSPIIAGAYNDYLYIGTNQGGSFEYTWGPYTGLTLPWNYISCSFDGYTFVAIAYDNNIYISRDVGSTWDPLPFSQSLSATALALSSDGAKIVVGTDSSNYIYTSPDYGYTWIEQTNSPLLSWTSVASSSNGQVLVATAASDYIYVSRDSGVTWTQQSGIGTGSWSSSLVSSNGARLYASSYDSPIVIKFAIVT